MDINEIKNIAHLARLELDESEAPKDAENMTRILALATQINEANCDEVEPMAHPLDLSQRLRDDEITAHIERNTYQALAPETEAGLYLVPVVIESEN